MKQRRLGVELVAGEEAQVFGCVGGQKQGIFGVAVGIFREKLGEGIIYPSKAKIAIIRDAQLPDSTDRCRLRDLAKQIENPRHALVRFP